MPTEILRAATPTAGESRAAHPTGNGRPRLARLLPLAPLIAASGRSGHHVRGTVRSSGTRFAQAGADGLAVDQAAVWADRLRLHPTEVWGRTWWEVA